MKQTNYQNLDANKIRLYTEFLKKGGNIAYIVNYDKNTLETIYNLAYHYYKISRFDLALKVLKYLAYLDQWNARHFKAIGYCYYHLKNYTKAIFHLTHAHKLDSHDANILLCITECFINLKSFRLAKKTLHETESLIAQTHNSNQHSTIQQLKSYLATQ